MGWTSYTLVGKTPKQELDSFWKIEDGNKLLRSCMKGTTYYAAIERHKSNGERFVFAAIFLTSYYHHEWYYKDMDETMCPYQYTCPKTILDLLTPTDNQYANKWRNECRKHIQHQEGLRKMPVGSKICFETEYDWTDGTKAGDTIILEKDHKGRWMNGWYKFRPSQIPYDYQIIQ